MTDSNPPDLTQTNYSSQLPVPPQALEVAGDAVKPANVKAAMDGDLSGGNDDFASMVQKKLKDDFPRSMKAAETSTLAQTQAEKQKADLANQTMDENKKVFAQEQADKYPDTSGSRPPPPVIEPAKSFGSFASLLGIMGSIALKTSAAGGLNAAASVMKAQREGSWDAYNAAMDKWKDDTKTLVDAWKDRQPMYADHFALLKENYALGVSRINGQATADGWDAMRIAATSGVIKQMTDVYESVNKGVGGAQKSVLEADKMRAEISATNALTEERKRKTALAEKMGGRTEKQITDLRGVQENIGQTLDNVDEAIKILNETYARSGIGGSILSYAEPVGNLLNYDSVSQQKFNERLAEIKNRIPDIQHNSKYQPSSQTMKTMDSVLGSNTMGHSTAATIEALQHYQKELIQSKKRVDDDLSSPSSTTQGPSSGPSPEAAIVFGGENDPVVGGED